jgi:hypothetical protein
MLDPHTLDHTTVYQCWLLLDSLWHIRVEHERLPPNSSRNLVLEKHDSRLTEALFRANGWECRLVPEAEA